MGRNNANLIKWISYAVAFLLIFFFESCVFNRFPAFGAVPMLAPLVVTAVARRLLPLRTDDDSRVHHHRRGRRGHP